MSLPIAKRRRVSPAQRGVTLFGLLFWGVLIAFLAIVGAKVTPTVMEYYTIQRAVNTVAAKNPPTVAQARTEFLRIKQVEYSIQIAPEDLEITKENEKVVISYAYTREIALGGPVYLLLKYEGRSN